MFPKTGVNPPKWMVYYNGKPYEQMDDLGGFSPPIFGLTPKKPTPLSLGREPPRRKNRPKLGPFPAPLGASWGFIVLDQWAPTSPRHPVIPPEVRCLGYVFGVQIPNLRRCLDV